MVDPLFLAELSERLFVMFQGGCWRAPLGTRLLPVPGFAGANLACAGAGDVARALAGLRPGPVDRDAMVRAYAAQAGLLRDLRALEGCTDPVDGPELPDLPGTGPLVLLSAAGAPLAPLAGALIAGAPRGVLWKPAPRAAASAHVLIEALAPVAGARLALLHGDHASGAALAGQGTLIWASDAAVPPGLPVSASLFRAHPLATDRPRP